MHDVHGGPMARRIGEGRRGAPPGSEAENSRRGRPGTETQTAKGVTSSDAPAGRARPIGRARRPERRCCPRGDDPIYLHLDLDAADALRAMGDEFAQRNGATPAGPAPRADGMPPRFDIAAAGVASCDPGSDERDRDRGAVSRVPSA